LAGHQPERAPAGWCARQSLNRRRAKSPHTTPAERPRRCKTTRHTFNLRTVIGESAAVAMQGHGSSPRTAHWVPWQLLRRPFALRGALLPSGAPRPRRCYRSEPRQPPGADSNPNPLAPSRACPPAPSGEACPRTGCRTPGPAPTPRSTKIRISCSGRLPR
jgi:hypothetical protein